MQPSSQNSENLGWSTSLKLFFAQHFPVVARKGNGGQTAAVWNNLCFSASPMSRDSILELVARSVVACQERFVDGQVLKRVRKTKRLTFSISVILNVLFQVILPAPSPPIVFHFPSATSGWNWRLHRLHGLPHWSHAKVEWDFGSQH